MQTQISEKYLNSHHGQQAEKILRKCVHCGFCTATCPTYQLLGDELDSPRGRIYLIKQLLEDQPVSQRTQQHLDRCLSCRSCETTCPSGVDYGKLVDIGRQLTEQQVKRPFWQQLPRYLLRQILPWPQRFKHLLNIGRLFRPLLPTALRQKIPLRQAASYWPDLRHNRKMLVLEGCVQDALSNNTNAATARVLDTLGISLIKAESGCCGAVSHHLAAETEGLDFMRRNTETLLDLVQQYQAEAIISTASGCGLMLKEYGQLLQHDPDYAHQAEKISQLCKDVSEIIETEQLPEKLSVKNQGKDQKVAFHSPCTLQHGQKLPGKVENILQSLGFKLMPIQDSHLCCGSAGTYSILQAKLSKLLLDNKLTALQKNQPDVIATANIGCQMHLASAADVPVVHWIELLDAAISKPAGQY